MKLRKCPKCQGYTLKEFCPKCSSATKEAHVKYRERFLRKQNIPD